jgi:phosphoribosylpyrophosphate synthetase
MVLQYSNQETSVTIGESVRDEDGMRASPSTLSQLLSRGLEPV